VTIAILKVQPRTNVRRMMAGHR